jgi:23S rRNA G2069 N7-methylase RlmK/C1962 C5-methylase RlmI
MATSFDWLRRLAKKGRQFDAVRARPADVFAIEGTRHVPRGKRLRQTRHRRAAVVKPGGILFASTNAADWPPEEFLATDGNRHSSFAKTEDLQRHYVRNRRIFPSAAANRRI